MGSGSAELWEPSVRAGAPLTSHSKGCWGVTRLLMDLQAAVPGVANHDAGCISPPCAAGYRKCMYARFKCPVCSKFVSSDEMDLHLVMCLTKPRITYNEDVLSKDAGECAICLEELQQGDTIARLPCLCIYHKGCIDEWFEVNRSCPEHPSD
ncbi:E3 ubiquitin-protein ligase ZNRF2 [Egretta garzetta]|uniref:E3 ubiquitin-protein ligase ZNRF2 n=1 Tax=Egretta garzetta TaxID=188379 RepID=UPI00051EF2B7|nr:E3 ubiquitin-protein ligase ZNRF2 [Egretta garzetta]